MKQLRLFPEYSKLQIGDSVIIISDQLTTLSGRKVPAQTTGIVQKLDPISVWTYNCGNLYSINIKHLKKI